MSQSFEIMSAKEFMSSSKRGLVGFFLLILSAYNINSTMFYHQHIIDGKIVYHSHFHSKFHTEGSEDGGHTVDVVKLIAVLGNIILEEQSFDSHIEEPLQRVDTYIYRAFVAETSLRTDGCRSLRAPPASFVA